MELFLGCSGNDDLGRLSFADDGDSNRGGFDYYHSGDTLRMFTGGAERFRLHDDANASLHTTSALGGLHIRSNSGDSTSHGTLTITANNTGTATGIMFFDGQSQSCGRISVLGGSNEISVITSSDYRLKQDIADLDTSWDTIKALKPRKFKWKANTSAGFHNGFIADELQGTIPEAAYGVKDATKTITNGVFQSNGNMMAMMEGLDGGLPYPANTRPRINLLEVEESFGEKYMASLADLFLATDPVIISKGSKDILDIITDPVYNLK